MSLFLAHQYMEQLQGDIRSAIFGNVGTLFYFRVGAKDAEHLEREFEPVFDRNDFISLPKFGIYFKLMNNGMKSKGFRAYTFQ